jgi:type I restriction enzyme S subunit
MLKFKWETNFDKKQIWTIPDDWNESRLGDFVHLKSGKYFRFSEFVESGVRCLKIDNVGFGEVVWNTITFLPEDYMSKHPDLILNEGDLVIALNRPIINGRIKVGRIKKEDSPSILYQRVGKIVFKERRLNSRYLFFIFLTELFKRQLSVSLVGTDQPYIRTPIFLSLKIPYPPFIEQSRVASVLSWFDDLIENKKRQNEILEKTAMAIFKSWFIDFEPFKDLEFVDSELGKIPKVWNIKKLNDICIIVMGQSPPSKYYNERGEGLPFVQGKGQFGKHFPKTNIYCSKIVKLAKSKDVLVTVRAPIGELNLSDKEYVIGRGLAALRSKYWIFLYLYLLINKELLRAQERGTTFDAITKQELEAFPILVPPQHILKDFHNLVEPLFQKILINHKQIIILENVRNVLLPLLVFGRLRVEEI